MAIFLKRGKGYLGPRPTGPSADPSYQAKHAARIFRGPTAASASIRRLIVEILDQLQLGSCVLNGTGQAIRCCQVRAKAPTPILPSRNDQYALCREDDGSPLDQDTGTYIHTAVDVIRRLGFAAETRYSDDQTIWSVKPTTQYEHDAIDQRDTTETSLHPIVGTDDEKWASVLQLLSNDVPVVWAGDVSNPFASNNFDPTKPIDAPAPAEVDGGHCMMLSGFPDVSAAEVANSWGIGWGNLGYFLMTRKYVLSASELYAVEHCTVSGVVL